MKKGVKLSSASVGIWWFTDNGQVWGVYCSLNDAVLDGIYYQYSADANHMTLWKQVVTDNVADETERQNIYVLGWKGLERGRVIYNTKTQCFEVICSEAIFNDLSARQAVKDAYGLKGKRVEFEKISHYCKLPLTGNPAVDRFNYE